MKINTSDYPVDKRVIFATQDQFIYDLPVTKLEMAWNSLARYYTEKLSLANAEAINVEVFYRMLAHSSVENETALNIYQLTQQNVLRAHPSVGTEERPVTLQAYIATGIRNILLRRLEELRENMAEEQETYNKIKDVNHEVKIEDGRIRVFFSYVRHLDFKKLEELSARQLCGLSCAITYRGIKLSYFEKKDFSDYCGLINAHFYEQTLLQSYTVGGLHVEISNEESNGADELCRTVLAELKQGYTLKQLHMLIIVGLSRICLERVLIHYEHVAFLDTEKVKLMDGRSRVFFVLAGRDVFKICRKTQSFDVYLNGKSLLFQGDA